MRRIGGVGKKRGKSLLGKEPEETFQNGKEAKPSREVAGERKQKAGNGNVPPFKKFKRDSSGRKRRNVNDGRADGRVEETRREDGGKHADRGIKWVD